MKRARISFGIGVGWGGGHHRTYVNVKRNDTFVRNSSSVRTGGRGAP